MSYIKTIEKLSSNDITVMKLSEVRLHFIGINFLTPEQQLANQHTIDLIHDRERILVR